MDHNRTSILKRSRKRKYPNVQGSKLDNCLIQEEVITSPNKKKKSSNKDLEVLKPKLSKKSDETYVLKDEKNIVSSKMCLRNNEAKLSKSRKIEKIVEVKVKKKTISKEKCSPKSGTKRNKTDELKIVKKKLEMKDKKKTASKELSTPKTTKASNLDSFHKESNKKTFNRNDSFDSIDLPTFKKVAKNKPKQSSKIKDRKASFQKYGVILPTVDEILKDKEDLEYRRRKIACFKPISEDSLELPFSNEITPTPTKQKGYDCKHLSLGELTSDFNIYVSLLSDIISEKIEHTRHQKYFNKNVKVLTMSTNDLTYNTSTIAFSYEQLDHLMNLLKKKFDPDDTKTKYFFQVLLPELCLRIFMKTYAMNLEQAIEYLSERPVI